MAGRAKGQHPKGRRATLLQLAGRHLDPYLVWALQTGLAGMARQGSGPEVIDFLVELDKPFDPTTHRWDMPPGARVDVPAAYAAPVPGTAVRARFITLRLHLQPAADAKAAVLALVLHAGVVRAQMGVPRPASPPDGAGSSLKDLPQHQTPGRAPDRAPKVVLGVLEDACPFAHQALRGRDSRTRVASLWDQSAVAPSSADPAPALFGYGRQRTQAQLQGLMARYQVDGRVDEERLYADPAALQPRVRQCSGTHASAVLGLMAGLSAQVPTRPAALAPRVADGPGARPQAADAAGQAPLVVVQLPREQIDIPGSRWFTVRALDGLRFILAEAERLAPGRQVPVVVNLSYGSVTGAHDGSALLEAAMQELATARQNLALVLAAGNAAGGPLRGEDPAGVSRGPRGYHASSHRLQPQAQASLRLLVPPEKVQETYLEIWFQSCVSVDKEDFLQPDEVTVDVTAPDGRQLHVARLPTAVFDAEDPDAVTAGLLAFERVAASRWHSMALLVVGGASTRAGRPAAAAGCWEVTVRNAGCRPLDLQAWVERDMIPVIGKPVQRARLVAWPGGASDFQLDDTNTLSNIATGLRVIRAGALSALGSTQRPVDSSYSSQPGKKARPVEFRALADESAALPGIRVCGNLSGSVARMNGTSMAAPQVARYLANQLAAGDALASLVPQEQTRSAPGGPRFGDVVLRTELTESDVLHPRS